MKILGEKIPPGIDLIAITWDEKGSPKEIQFLSFTKKNLEGVKANTFVVFNDVVAQYLTINEVPANSPNKEKAEKV